MSRRIIRMNQRLNKTLCVALALMGSMVNLHGQNNSDRSPYSRYGFGTLSSQTTAGARAMGGVGIALRDATIVNPLNPASYTSVDSLTFIMDMGISARASWLSDGKGTDRRLQGNIDYATILFPLGKHMAMSAGILPLASTGYSFGSMVKTEGQGQGVDMLRTYTGSGGYSDLYLGLAGKPTSWLSVGLNGSYLFGRTVRRTQSYYSQAGAINPVTQSSLHLRGFKIEGGVQAEIGLDSVGYRKLIVGLVGGQSLSMRSEYTLLRYSQENGVATGQLSSPDTVRTSGNTYKLPLHIGAGLTYKLTDKYQVSIDGLYTQWSKANYPNMAGSFTDQYRLSIGGEWIPDSRARGLFSRTRYRFGLYGTNSYILVPTTEGSKGYYEFGGSVGFGFPLVDRRSYLNLSFDYKRIQPTLSSLVTEQYVGVTVGITFNEGWFRKARVN